MVHLGRDIVLVQRAVQGRLVVPRPRVEDVRLQMGIKLDPEGLPELVVRRPESLKDRLPILAIRRRAMQGVAGLVECGDRAVAERHLRIRHLRVAKDGVHRAGAGGHLAGPGQDLFLLLRERVRFAAQDIEQIHPILLQPRLGGDEFLNRLFFERDDFGLDKGGLGAVLRDKLLNLLLHGQIRRIARILIGLHRRIGVQAAERFGDLAVELQAGEHLRRRLGQRSLNARMPSSRPANSSLACFHA